jgi:DNA-binding NarL/FixJ family response regulator
MRSIFEGRCHLEVDTSSWTHFRMVIEMEAVMNRDIFRSAGTGTSLQRDDSNKGSEELRLFDLLTPRQHEVLRLVAEGYSTKQIALELGISAKTVETHRAQLTERLDIHDVAGLVRYALKTGIVSIDQPPLAKAIRLDTAKKQFK